MYDGSNNNMCVFFGVCSYVEGAANSSSKNKSAKNNQNVTMR